MAASIDLYGVTLDYAVYGVRAQSLRNALANLAVGGRLMRGKSDLTHIRALSEVSLSARPGDRIALVGHNGSGKSSLLKVLAGVYEPNQGHVGIEGRISSMISMSIGLDGEASGLQNMRNLAMMQMMPRAELERRLPSIVDFSELGAFVHMPFKTYSAGMMARLTFAVAKATDADILLMDEWISAGDASFREKASERLSSLVDRAEIVVLATHDDHLVRRTCNRVIALETGVVTFTGSADEYFSRKAAA